MRKMTFFFAVLYFSVIARAEDLESIFDSAAEKPAVTVEKVAPKLEKMSPLVSALRKAVGIPNSEQNIFLRYVESGDWEKVALQFSAAFEGTEFQKSANGRAIYGLAEFRAGLPITGLQTLFMATNPNDIHELIQDEWRSSAPVEHFAWGIAKIPWKPTWGVVFGAEQGIRIRIEEALASNDTSIEQLLSLSKLAPANSELKARVDWQTAIAYAVKDQGDLAAKVLAGLMKNPKATVSKDLLQTTAARLLFQNGYFDPSVKYYEKVSKNSEYWTEAQEEIGWAYLRKGEPNNAKAISQSLTNPVLKFQTSPEAFFIQALSQLKICDYKGVTETLQQFPKRFKERTEVLEKMSVQVPVTEADQSIALLKKQKIRQQDIGKLAQVLPRRFAHDEKLYRFAQVQKHLEAEAEAAEKIYARSLALTGLQASFDSIRQASLRRAEAAKSASYERLKDLARLEVAETKEILRKLHIVEAEVIQQVSLADRVIKGSVGNKIADKQGVTGYKGTAEAVRFPSEREVWFDELSNYRVDVKKACTVRR
ncbi:MAG: hypothetical protein H7326_09245 [Bdellovibrionaceae bacterium]|nr:hypothetical protein [Pseudobdellovibrionaceae bacterium]